MDESQDIFGAELSEDDQRLIVPTLQEWKASTDKRDAARLDFQNKLAVLCAGSIAVLASGVVAIANSTTLRPKLPSHFAVYVIVAAASLWLSLVCCTVHNYLETALLERESRSKLDDALLAVADLGWKRRGLPKEDRRQFISALPLAKERDQRAQRSLQMEQMQPYLTLAGVLLFCFGYLAVIVFICVASLR